MSDERDFRIRMGNMVVDNMTLTEVASPLGQLLANAVVINPEAANYERPFVRIEKYDGGYWSPSVDVVLPPEAANHADEVRDALLPFYQNGVVINEDQEDEIRGFIEVERCGHRLVPPQPCEIIARWEVGRGRII